MTEVKRFGVFQTAKFMGIMHALIAAVVVLPFSLLMAAAGFSSAPDNPLVGLLSGAGVFLMPIFYGIMGFVTTAIACFAYNIVAGFVGGIEVELN